MLDIKCSPATEPDKSFRETLAEFVDIHHSASRALVSVSILRASCDRSDPPARVQSDVARQQHGIIAQICAAQTKIIIITKERSHGLQRQSRKPPDSPRRKHEAASHDERKVSTAALIWRLNALGWKTFKLPSKANKTKRKRTINQTTDHQTKTEASVGPFRPNRSHENPAWDKHTLLGRSRGCTRWKSSVKKKKKKAAGSAGRTKGWRWAKVEQLPGVNLTLAERRIS